MNTDTLALGILWYVVFLLSTTCHEAAHAYAAQLGGDLTAALGGQVSLDPRPHMRREPFGMIVFPLLTYFMNGWMMGWASAPYDPGWSRTYPHRSAMMALAGPLANFSLAGLAAILIRVGMAAGFLALPESANFSHVVDAAGPGMGEAVATFLSLLFSLNILLGAFNLLPIPPLDGFGGVGLLMSEHTARKWQDLGASMRAYTMIGMLISWQIFGHLFHPIFSLSLRALYPGSGF